MKKSDSWSAKSLTVNPIWNVAVMELNFYAGHFFPSSVFASPSKMQLHSSVHHSDIHVGVRISLSADSTEAVAPAIGEATDQMALTDPPLSENLLQDSRGAALNGRVDADEPRPPERLVKPAGKLAGKMVDEHM